MESSIFRDPIWQFVGIIIGALVTVLCTWLAIYLTRTRKSISWAGLESRYVPMEDWDQEIIKYFADVEDKDKPKGVSYLRIRIGNTGDLPIVPEEFMRPIAMGSIDSNVILCRVIENSPRNINANIVVADGKACLEPLLLNPSDTIVLEIITDSHLCAEIHRYPNGMRYECGRPIFEIDGRVIGVEAVRRIGQVSWKQFGRYWLSLFSILVSGIVIMAFGVYQNLNVVASVGGGVAVTVVLLGIFFSLRDEIRNWLFKRNI